MRFLIFFSGRIVTLTLKDWAFLSRFCFVSERGRYEYEIEFDRMLGEPQLLLYYDEPNQWHSVYKSEKVRSGRDPRVNTFSRQILPADMSAEAVCTERRRQSDCKIVGPIAQQPIIRLPHRPQGGAGALETHAADDAHDGGADKRN